MPSTDKFQTRLGQTGVLATGETVQFVTVCAVKQGAKSQLAKSAGFTAAASTAATLAAWALGSGMGLMVVRVPPAVFCVVTDQRILLFQRNGTHNTARAVGAPVFGAPRAALASDLSAGLMNTLTLRDPDDGQSLLALRFGVRRSAPRTIAEACQGAAPSA